MLKKQMFKKADVLPSIREYIYYTQIFKVE